MKRGKFIVIYGANNVGKTTQVKLLAQKLEKLGKSVKTVKYPVYELEPTGPVINNYLRGGGQLPGGLEMNKLYAQNRLDFEPTLDKWLGEGWTVVAEDYVGTGFVRGIIDGLNEEIIKSINMGTREPDISIVLDGPRRIEAIEPMQAYEHDGRWAEIKMTYLDMAGKMGWKVVDGSAPVEKVAEEIWEIIKPIFRG